MIASLIKQIIGAGATRPFLASHVKKIFSDRVNILFFHYFGKRVPYYNLPQADFSFRKMAKNINLLSLYFNFAPLKEIVDDCGLAEPMDKPRLAITFDDGFDLLGNGVVDFLENRGIKATFFVITNCLDNRRMMWRHKLFAMLSAIGPKRLVFLYNELANEVGGNKAKNVRHVFSLSRQEWGADSKDYLTDRLWALCGMLPEDAYLARHRPYLGEADIRQLLGRGHEIGLHTKSHPLCNQLDEEGAIREIVEPAQMLRDTFGLSFLPFAYPFGRRLERAREKELYEQGIFNCSLGVRGMSPKGSPPYSLERSDCESSVEFAVFGRHLLISLMPFLQSRD